MTPSIAVVGSINVDVVVRSARLPSPGETIHGESFALTLGGKGANQACAAARLGADVTFVGATGTDGFAAFAREKIAGFGLDLGLIREDAAHGTGIAVISVDQAGQNAITVVAGANAGLSQADVTQAREGLKSARALLLQCETPLQTSLAAARIVKAAGGCAILDPAPAPSGGVPMELIDNIDIITPNESEAAALVGHAVTDRDSALAAARALRARHPRLTAVVKLGGAGLVWSGPNSEGFVPPFSVHVVDTVAAGDCFNAGLAFALAGEGAESLAANPAPSLRFASACGALAVTRPGAAEAAPTLESVRVLLGA